MEGRGGDYSHGIYTMPQLPYLCLESTITIRLLLKYIKMKIIQT